MQGLNELIEEQKQVLRAVLPESVNATEAAKRKAEELGVDLSRIEGSGSGGLIIVKDVVAGAHRYALFAHLPASFHSQKFASRIADR